MRVTGEPLTVAPAYATVRVLLNGAGDPGVNPMLMVQRAPEARVAPQVPPAAPAGRENG